MIMVIMMVDNGYNDVVNIAVLGWLDTATNPFTAFLDID